MTEAAEKETKDVKVTSWNVNGLRAILKKDVGGTKQDKQLAISVLQTLLTKENPDFLCLQEIKCSADFCWVPEGYPYTYANYSTDKKGYSGVLIASKIKPLDGSIGLAGITESEGRVITVEFEKYVLINVYSPNTGSGRKDYRIKQWEPALRAHIKTWSEKGKPVILVGDLNCVGSSLDIGTSYLMAGMSSEEIFAFNTLLKECAMVDTFRMLHPTAQKYTWMDPKLRRYNKGARIDFALFSAAWKDRVKVSDMLDYPGSDHVPLVLTFSA
ncbi:Endonuclease/exonuclease/phosphatase family protein [uncultured virus]|nr:Endonuclease/exonuclease/phosphatase family protein [uncultured virus]